MKIWMSKDGYGCRYRNKQNLIESNSLAQSNSTNNEQTWTKEGESESSVCLQKKETYKPTTHKYVHGVEISFNVYIHHMTKCLYVSFFEGWKKKEMDMDVKWVHITKKKKESHL
jgi:hypothetical protein